MNSVKFIHVSDLGLRNLPYGGLNPETGLNRRFEDVFKNFQLIASEAIKRKIEYFVIAGDINEERNPESILIEKFSGIIADLISQDIKVIVIAGNHDVDSSKGTSSSISYLKSLGLINTHVADLGPETFEFENIVFHCVPYMFPGQLGYKTNDEVTRWLDDYISGIALTEGKMNVLVSHYSLETTFDGLDVDEPVLKINYLKKFDYVALGHIHKYEMNREFIGGFSGSMFCKDFGEQNDKYFNIITKPQNQTEIEQVEIPERTFKQFDFDLTKNEFNPDCFPIYDIQRVEGCIVKIRIKTYQRFNPKIIYDHLRTQKVFHYVPIEWKIVRTEKSHELTIGTGISDIDIAKEYYNKQELKDEFKNDVINYTEGIITKWNEELVSH